MTMKKDKTRIVAVVLMLAASSCATRDARLYGVWRSDQQATIAFNQKCAKLTEAQTRVFVQMFGHLTVEYKAGGEVIYSQEAYTLTKGTNSITMTPFHRVSCYTIVGRNSTSVVIREPGIFVPGEEFTQLHFVSSNAFWEYIGDSSIFNLHMREYFKRQQ